MKPSNGNNAQALAVLDTLHALVSAQREELQSGKTSLSTNGNNVLSARFLESEAFRQIYREALGFNLMPRTDDELKEFRECFAGRVYQDLVYALLTSRQPESRVVLSPQRTLELFGVLFPDSPRTRHLFGDSLAGIFVPDGILVGLSGGRERILVVYEYTAADLRNSRWKNKLYGFESDRKCFPELFSSANLLFVVPKNLGLQPEARYRGVVAVETPFTKQEFGDFVKYSFDYRLDEDSATLTELQQRAREQYRHLANYHRSREQPTPEVMRYLERIKASKQQPSLPLSA